MFPKPRTLLVACGVALLETPVSRGQDPTAAQPATPPPGASRHLKNGTTYEVEWVAPPAWDADVEVEFDSGRYLCCHERWPALEGCWILPLEDGAEIVRFTTGGGNAARESREVAFQSSPLRSERHRALLRDLSWITSARLAPQPVSGAWSTTGCRLWNHVRVVRGTEPLLEQSWAGGLDSADEIRYAKVAAVVERLREDLERIPFQSATLVPEERHSTLEATRSRTYAGLPWKAFPLADLLTPLYRRTVEAIGGDPAGVLPKPRRVVVLRIEDAAGRPLFPARFTCRDRSGRLVPVVISPLVTLARFEFGLRQIRLEPGAYALEIEADGHRPLLLPLVVGDSTPKETLVRLELLGEGR